MNGPCPHADAVAIYRSAEDTVLFCPACGLASIRPALEEGDSFALLNTPDLCLPFLVRGR